jgi:hypothetical protein
MSDRIITYWRQLLRLRVTVQNLRRGECYPPHGARALV